MSRFPRLGVVALLPLLLLGACSDDDGGAAESDSSESSEAPESVGKMSDIPDLTVLERPADADRLTTFRTAEVVNVRGGADGSVVNVEYQRGPDACSEFVGYAREVTEESVRVTVVVGETESCDGEPVQSATVIPIGATLGEREMSASIWSEKSLPIEDPDLVKSPAQG